jgi:hypothetical protein
MRRSLAGPSPVDALAASLTAMSVAWAWRPPPSGNDVACAAHDSTSSGDHPGAGYASGPAQPARRTGDGAGLGGRYPGVGCTCS